MLSTAPTFEHLYRLFPDSPDRPDAVEVAAGELPEAYYKLLVHTHHMTVTVERFYGDAVDVKVLDARHAGDFYARKILLALRDSGEVVQFGIVQIDLSFLAPVVRDE